MAEISPHTHIKFGGHILSQSLKNYNVYICGERKRQQPHQSRNVSQWRARIGGGF